MYRRFTNNFKRTTAEYTLGGILNTIFASRYTLYIPNKEVLHSELEKVISAYERKLSN